MINRDKLRAFRDWFRECPMLYSQSCNTGCIAYHAHVWDTGKDDAQAACPAVLARIFGVSAKVAYAMYNHPTHWHPFKEDAITMLDKLIETGKVVWPE